MQRIATSTILTAATLAVACLAPAVASAAPTAGGQPVVERGSIVDTFEDDFILDLCGIETLTTVTERWSSKKFPDGSEIYTFVRTFVPEDPRIPVEKGAGASFFAPDGSRTTVGTPIHLFHPDGGTMLIDAGRALFDADGDVVAVDGPHPALDADLAEYYCPS
jgi:hypothetical protein